MTEGQTNQQLYPGFNYADPQTAGSFLPVCKLEEDKPILVAFLKDIPGMQSPPIVYARVHWFSEMGEKGARIQCFGGACCEQVTWQKGFGGAPGKFAPSKAQTRYFCPVVVYEPDKTNQTQIRAVVKYLDITWVAYSSLCQAIDNTPNSLPFWERDILVTTKKVNGALTYSFDRREDRAQWLVNPVFTQQVNEQLPSVPERLCNSLPKLMTEAEFMELKPSLDTKVQASINSQMNTQAQQQPQAQFGTLPQAQQQFPGMTQFNQMYNPQPAMAPQPMVQQFTQPQVNMPIQPQPVSSIQEQPQQVNTPAQPINPSPVQQFTQPQVNVPVQPVQPQPVQPQPVNPVPEQPQQVAQPQPETKVEDVQILPNNLLDFDPSSLLK